MSILSNIEAILQKDEAWITQFLIAAKADFISVESELASFWTWLAAHAGEISQDAQAVTGTLATLQAAGLVIPSVVTTAVAAMNTAVSGLNAAVTSAAAGAAPVNVVVAAYTAAKQAEIAHAQAAIAVVTAAPSSTH